MAKVIYNLRIYTPKYRSILYDTNVFCDPDFFNAVPFFNSTTSRLFDKFELLDKSYLISYINYNAMVNGIRYMPFLYKEETFGVEKYSVILPPATRGTWLFGEVNWDYNYAIRENTWKYYSNGYIDTYLGNTINSANVLCDTAMLGFISRSNHRRQLLSRDEKPIKSFLTGENIPIDLAFRGNLIVKPNAWYKDDIRNFGVNISTHDNRFVSGVSLSVNPFKDYRYPVFSRVFSLTLHKNYDPNLVFSLEEGFFIPDRKLHEYFPFRERKNKQDASTKYIADYNQL